MKQAPTPAAGIGDRRTIMTTGRGLNNVSMSRQERRNQQKRNAKLIPSHLSPDDVQQAFALYEGVIQEGTIIAEQRSTIADLKKLLNAAKDKIKEFETLFEIEQREGRIMVQDSPHVPSGEIVQIYTDVDIDQAHEDGIVKGIMIYGVAIHGALYDLRETLANIHMLSTLSHNPDSRIALSALQSDLVKHWDAFETQTRHLKDAANIDTDPDWLNELNANFTDIRDAIIAYTSPNITLEERARREKHFRAVCQTINPDLAKIKTIIESIPVRKRIMDDARDFVAHRLKGAFQDTRRAAPTDAAYTLLEELEARKDLPRLSKGEKAAYGWLKGFKDDRRRMGKEINDLKNQVIRMSEDN